jgi:hypothetical protein
VINAKYFGFDGSQGKAVNQDSAGVRLAHKNVTSRTGNLQPHVSLVRQCKLIRIPPS